MTKPAMMDTAAIAEALHVSRAHVTDRLTKRPDFPRPSVNVSQRLRLWDAEAVMTWAAGNKPAAPGGQRRRAISSAVSR